MLGNISNKYKSLGNRQLRLFSYKDRHNDMHRDRHTSYIKLTGRQDDKCAETQKFGPKDRHKDRHKDIHKGGHQDRPKDRHDDRHKHRQSHRHKDTNNDRHM